MIQSLGNSLSPGEKERDTGQANASVILLIYKLKGLGDSKPLLLLNFGVDESNMANYPHSFYESMDTPYQFFP